jgi:hypothetical protein
MILEEMGKDKINKIEDFIIDRDEYLEFDAIVSLRI